MRTPTVEDLLVLNLLRTSGPDPLHALDLVDSSTGVLQRGTIYVTLAHLEEEGLVHSVEAPIGLGHLIPRRLYSITEKGKKLDLTKSIETAPGIIYRIQMFGALILMAFAYLFRPHEIEDLAWKALSVRRRTREILAKKTQDA